ncbi:hypothetical protein [Methylomonas methanica]|uniref:Uncharacterized protein n=1 Tax=Methylomonas methanica (strain DSM 25384 / MC09) TaxID=857087 RepID=G0A4K0_METMM|nr:hypothetical protein [Methylomonas methanica]AEG01591.1 hypothetical protein Metme_3217 [Methylomonas methanica MC09]
MIISATALAWLVGTATLATLAAPVILIIFWIRDLLKGQLW